MDEEHRRLTQVQKLERGPTLGQRVKQLEEGPKAGQQAKQERLWFFFTTVRGLKIPW